MSKYFSKSTMGFYDSEINPSIPDDAIELTDSRYNELIDGQANGQEIILDNDDNPILRDVRPSPCYDWNGSEWVMNCENAKALLKKSLADYRYSLTRSGIMRCGDYFVECGSDARIRLSEARQAIEDSSGGEPATFPFKDPLGVWHTVNTSEVPVWRSQMVLTETLESFPAEKTISDNISDLTTESEIIAYDVIAEFDAILKPALSADLEKYAYPKKYWDIDNEE